jgi:hypothetical protein
LKNPGRTSIPKASITCEAVFTSAKVTLSKLGHHRCLFVRAWYVAVSLVIWSSHLLDSSRQTDARSIMLVGCALLLESAYSVLSVAQRLWPSTFQCSSPDIADSCIGIYFAPIGPLAPSVPCKFYRCL